MEATKIKTQNGNYIVHDGEHVFYMDSNNQFLSRSSQQEWDWARDSWGEEMQDAGDVSYIAPGYVYPEIIREDVETVWEDFSNHDPDKCFNGGAYGFWRDEYSITFKDNDGVERMAVFSKEKTTADFDYCQDSGSFTETKCIDVITNIKGVDYVIGCIHVCRSMFHGDVMEV